ncbi:enterobactin transporter EntS [Rhodococcus sp. HNM0569]|uniref:enterobactin transporter EntS n=1 Tax=Rhodococcus sp. HNM0569 TaxID=2716340 RepID=UPI00146CF9C9|nr:enterobactin transporter EntS [Rhodococcus sp. HNM0569]NLU82800.1 enterobactin transporter EntS [Rhodococcus sp. HNM0569]
MAANRVLIDLRPLKVSAPFRRVFVARTISIFGIGMLAVGVPIQVYDLTGSSFLVGAVSAAEGIASIGGMLLGGNLADRYDRRRLILFARTVSGLTFVGLALNAMSASPSVVAIVVLAVINGLIGSISVSALMSVIPTLIPREQLVGAGAINVLGARLGSVLSPALGGVVIAAGSVAWNYWIAAIGTVITVTALWGLPSLPPATHHGDGDDGPKETSVLRYLVQARVVGGVIVAGTVAMLGGGVLVLVPAFVAQRFESDSRVTGLLYAASAVGAVVVTLTSGILGRASRPGLVLLSALVAGFAVQALVGFTTIVAVTMLVMVVAGAVLSAQEILRFSLIQSHTPAHLRGRVSGLWTAQEVGGMSIGALVAGAYGTWFAPDRAIVWYSVSALAVALVVFALFGALRRVSAVREPDAAVR